MHCSSLSQENIAVDTFTFRENITFSATLRLPCCTTARERSVKVSSIIDELGLTSVADRIISFLGTQSVCGVSGGERKRTCIGIELVSDPLILYLDEPTTGLDAYTAESIIQTLRRISIYCLFDRLTIISDGQIIYHGPAGQTPIAHFESCDINEHDNTCKTVRETVHRRLVARWLESTLCKQCKIFLAEYSKSFNINRLTRWKQLKLSKSQKLSSTTTTNAARHTHHKLVKFNKQSEQYDCECIQPGNYLSILNKEIKKFDELWVLSHSLSTTDSNHNGDSDDDHLHNTNVDYLLSETFLKGFKRSRDFPSDSLFYVQMNDQVSKTHKHIGCYSCECNSQSSDYRKFATPFCQQLFTLNWRSYLSMKRHETSTGFYRISAYFISKILSDVLPTKITSGYLVNISTLWKWLQLFSYISILRYAINLLAINELSDMTFCPQSTLSHFKLFSIDVNSVNISDSIYPNLSSLLSVNEWRNTEYFQTDIEKTINLQPVCVTGVQYLQSQAIEYQSKWSIWLNELGILVIAISALCVAYIHLRLINRYK
ncbi:ATP-binding cassette sub-family G member 2 [Schistosoma japonicum]|nr:ATP-binding cassette sub-family G member 2 [Schistosoma japonicum]